MRTAPARRLLLLAGLPFLFATLPDAGIAASSESASLDPRLLATVDEDSVTVGDLLVLLAGQKPPASTAEAALVSTDGVLRRLIQNRLMEHEAFRMGLDTAPEVKSQVDDMIRHRAMLAMLDSLQTTVPKPEREATVENRPVTSTMLHVAHIVVETEAEARSLRDRIQSGASFAELADANSLDKEWAQPGGDLGWAREDKFIPEFAAALRGLARGDVSAPVKTEQGWHLLKVLETHTEVVGDAAAMAEAARRDEMSRRVMETVNAFVESLARKYDVVPNDSLLATLDYGSEDSAVLRAMQESGEVLVTLPWRTITVGDLTRQIRFEHFHGLAGKPDAPQLRDRAFRDWVTEMLLRHEAIQLGFHHRPEIVTAADRDRRERMREVLGREILNVPFEPSEREVESYYRKHEAEFTSVPRVRVEGVLLRDEASATRFRQRVEAGSQMGWLADRTKEVVDARPARLADWMEPSEIGLDADKAQNGAVVGPLAMDGAWAVARVLEMRPGQIVPLERCRGRVLSKMKTERLEFAMQDALARLEDQASVRIVDDADRLVREQIDRWVRMGSSAGATEAMP